MFSFSEQARSRDSQSQPSIQPRRGDLFVLGFLLQRDRAFDRVGGAGARAVLGHRGDVASDVSLAAGFGRRFDAALG